MAVPKKRRSTPKARRRRMEVFMDSLGHQWKTRREWFYRRFHHLKFMPKDYVQHTFRFPGFWPGSFTHAVAEVARKAIKK
mmetsp:Transcript_56142/g.109913  ORF Transcript_56142/g.109913 Transcript_56142/m.109913 type:complete len:80 (+) Transcript_56142:345-584(+)